MSTGRRYNQASAFTEAVSATVPQYLILSAATIRVKIYEVNSGADGTPADTAHKFSFQRITTNYATNGTARTPTALDPADPASLATYSDNAAANATLPTLTANSFLLTWTQNGRANFRWIAAPDGELVLPATAVNGTGLQCLTATTVAAWVWNTQWAE